MFSFRAPGGPAAGKRWTSRAHDQTRLFSRYSKHISFSFQHWLAGEPAGLVPEEQLVTGTIEGVEQLRDLEAKSEQLNGMQLEKDRADHLPVECLAQSFEGRTLRTFDVHLAESDIFEIPRRKPAVELDGRHRYAFTPPAGCSKGTDTRIELRRRIKIERAIAVADTSGDDSDDVSESIQLEVRLYSLDVRHEWLEAEHASFLADPFGEEKGAVADMRPEVEDAIALLDEGSNG